MAHGAAAVQRVRAPARGNAKKENLSWIETLELDCVKKACAILGDWGPDEEGGNDVSAAVSFSLSLSLSRRQTHTQTEDRARFITIVTQQQHQQQQKIPSLPNAECRSQRIYLLALCLSSSPFSPFSPSLRVYSLPDTLLPV